MGQLGFQELLVIFIIALLVFGPKKLPELGKSLGKGLREFKRATNELKSTWEDQVRETENEFSSTAKDFRDIGKEVERDMKSPEQPVAAKDPEPAAPTTPAPQAESVPPAPSRSETPPQKPS